MQHTFVFSNSNKRYHTYDYYLKQKYQSKVFKVALDGGFSCPNRDGSKSSEGCIFCSRAGAGEFAGSRSEDLATQFEKQVAIMHQKWPIAKYIAYFQAYTNTYGPLAFLQSRFEPFVTKENVVGLAIATRPDCLSQETLNYLEILNQKTDLYVELGLQTIHDKTAVFINRQYSYATFEKAVNELAKRKIKIVVHIINGLPYETKEMMIATSRALAKLPIHGLKIHQLLILKDTQLADLFQKELFSLLSLEAYVDIVVEQLSYLPPHLVIQRINADGKRSELIAPDWSIKKNTIINAIDKKMARDQRMQGDHYEQ